MPSQSGSVYGLTLLCPIIDDDNAVPSHDLQIRDHLARLSLEPDRPVRYCTWNASRSSCRTGRCHLRRHAFL